MSDLLDLPELAAAAVPQSPLERFQRRAAELREGELLDLDLPGYNGETVIRMQTITDPEEARAVARGLVRAAQESAAEENREAAVIISRYAVDFCGVNSAGRYVSIDGEPEPLTFSQTRRFARILDRDPEEFESAKDLLFAAVGADRRLTITGLAQRYLTWVTGMDEGARKTLKGESRATLP